MYRHHPQTRVVADLVAGGAVGRLRTIRASSGFTLPAGDVRLDAELDGGALMDVGCYCVSGSRLLAGEPEHVYGEQVVGETGVDLAFHGTLRFPDDVVAQFDCSFVQPRGQGLEAVGEEGTLVVETPFRPDWGGDVLLVRDDETTRFEVPEARMFALELENFAAAIAGDAPPLLGPRGRARSGAGDRRALPLGGRGPGASRCSAELERLDRPVRDAPARELARADGVDQVRPPGPEADVLDVRPRRPRRRRDVRVEDRQLVAVVLEEPATRARCRARSGTARRPRSCPGR